MPSIDLPRQLQDYFAFTETEPTRHGRRFSITLPYFEANGRLGRLQWWYHLCAAREKGLGETALETLRRQAVERFTIHIERWLNNTGQLLTGTGTIPHLRHVLEEETAVHRQQSDEEHDPADTICPPQTITDGQADTEVPECEKPGKIAFG
jgi:hypothetical protein